MVDKADAIEIQLCKRFNAKWEFVQNDKKEK